MFLWEHTEDNSDSDDSNSGASEDNTNDLEDDDAITDGVACDPSGSSGDLDNNEEGYAYDVPSDLQIPKSNIVDQFRQAWGKRRKKLVHDYSITGWMLSPIPMIMADAAANHTGYHRLAVDRLIKKLMAPSGDFATEVDRHIAVGHLLNTFWTEHEIFHSKCGAFGNREHIWQSKDIHGTVLF